MENIERDRDINMFLVHKEVNGTILDILQRIVEVL